MGSFTAQILIGDAHPNHGGIIPTHFLFLSENDRPAWILVNENISNQGKPKDICRIVWIPTVEDMLEDALLMAAIHVAKNPEVIVLAKSFSSRVQQDRLELYSDLNDDQRKELYRKCRMINDFPKLVISVFEGSTVKNQLAILEKYNMDVEVCTVGYSRISSGWREETIIEGSLERDGV